MEESLYRHRWELLLRYLLWWEKVCLVFGYVAGGESVVGFYVDLFSRMVLNCRVGGFIRDVPRRTELCGYRRGRPTG